MSYLRQANAHYAQTRASRHLPEHLDRTVEDLLASSHTYRAPCNHCQGRGQVPTLDASGQPTETDTCGLCDGTGARDYPADPAARKLALEIGGLLPKKGGTTLSVGVQSVVQQGPSGGRLERLQAAIAATFDDD